MGLSSQFRLIESPYDGARRIFQGLVFLRSEKYISPAGHGK